MASPPKGTKKCATGDTSYEEAIDPGGCSEHDGPDVRVRMLARRVSGRSLRALRAGGGLPLPVRHDERLRCSCPDGLRPRPHILTVRVGQVSSLPAYVARSQPAPLCPAVNCVAAWPISHAPCGLTNGLRRTCPTSSDASPLLPARMVHRGSAVPILNAVGPDEPGTTAA
jgi:hypothetical protein